MIKYTHEVIINSLGTTSDPKVVYDSAKKVLTIKRAGQYKVDKISLDAVGDKKVAATAGVAPTMDKAVLNCTGLIKSETAGSDNTIYETGLYNLAIYLKTYNQFLGEFANANWYTFGKPLIIGFDVTEALAKNASALATKIAELVNLAVPENNKFVKATASAANVTIEVVDNPYLHFGNIVFERYDPTVCDSCLGEYFERDLTGKLTITPGKEPFATGEWLIENLRFPTYPNVRYKALNADEAPVPGKLYDEYSFCYVSDRPGYVGMSGAGETVQASTRHIFYVLHDLATEFEAKLTEAGLTKVTK